MLRTIAALTGVRLALLLSGTALAQELIAHNAAPSPAAVSHETAPSQVGTLWSDLEGLREAWAAPYVSGVPADEPTGACCLGGACQLLTHAACLAAFGTYQGDGSDCDPNPCYPCPCCYGDVNCDGARDFHDIDPFVARLGCPFVDPLACNTPPTCAWIQADVDVSGMVDFDDIDPFIALLGRPCW